MPVLARCRSARPRATWPCSSSTGTTRICACGTIAKAAARKTTGMKKERFIRQSYRQQGPEWQPPLARPAGTPREDLLVIGFVQRDDFFLAELPAHFLVSGGRHAVVQGGVGHQAQRRAGHTVEIA